MKNLLFILLTCIALESRADMSYNISLIGCYDADTIIPTSKNYIDSVRPGQTVYILAEIEFYAADHADTSDGQYHLTFNRSLTKESIDLGYITWDELNKNVVVPIPHGGSEYRYCKMFIKIPDTIDTKSVFPSKMFCLHITPFLSESWCVKVVGDPILTSEVPLLSDDRRLVGVSYYSLMGQEIKSISAPGIYISVKRFSDGYSVAKKEFISSPNR